MRLLAWICVASRAERTPSAPPKAGYYPDIEIVGEVQDEAEIARVVKETQPDFLIVALDEPTQRPPICDELLRIYPEMRILALAPEHNSSLFFWASLDIHANRVEASEEGILGALRSKTQGAGGQP